MSPDADTAADGGHLSYRERDVVETLDEHDRRINRLEKAGLIGMGYALAQGGDLATALVGLI